MRFIDKQTAGDATRLIIFIVVTTLATGLLAITIGNVSFGATKSYQAVFSDATGVVKGDEIRVAGVKVGSVKGVEIYDRTEALVKLSVETTTELPESPYATLRYRILVVHRYLGLP